MGATACYRCKAQQVAAIGNSVCPEVAEQIVRANVQIRQIARTA